MSTVCKNWLRRALDRLFAHFKEATRPAGANILQQQAKFDAFIKEFNNERPHEALQMKCPAEVYLSSIS